MLLLTVYDQCRVLSSCPVATPVDRPRAEGRLTSPDDGVDGVPAPEPLYSHACAVAELPDTEDDEDEGRWAWL